MSKLRVGLFVESMSQPRWISRAIELVAMSGCGEIVLVVEVTPPSHGCSHGASSALPTLRHVLFSLYAAIDRRCFATAPDPTARVDMAPALRGVTILRIETDVPGNEVQFSARDRRAIAEHELDVGLWLAGSRPGGDCAMLARYGCWSHFFADALSAGGELAGFQEVMQALPETISGISVFGGRPEADKVIYLSSARTFPYSFRRNQENVLRKTSEFVFRKIRDLQLKGAAALQPAAPEHAGRRTGLTAQVPDAARMTVWLGKLLGRIAWRAMQKLLFIDQWVLAYRFGPDNDAGTGSDFLPVLPPTDRFWADPFPVEKDGRYYVFFEELMFDTQRGHLAVLEICRNGTVSAPVTVLQRDHHMSYPFVFEWEGELYMVPETGEKRTVELYRCVSFPAQWVFDRVLIDNLRAVDATLHQVNGRWWMFVNVSPEGVEIFDELHLYHADSPFGPWLSHQCNPVVSDVKRARPAGRLFRRNGELFRPAQICAPIYGAGMQIHRIVTLTAEEFREEPCAAGWPAPGIPSGFIGTHTLNRAGPLVVIDGFIRRRRFF